MWVMVSKVSPLNPPPPPSSLPSSDRAGSETVVMQQALLRHWRRAEGGGCQRHGLLPANLPAWCRPGKTFKDIQGVSLKRAPVLITPVFRRSALQINAVQASMVLFIGKAWGAVTDPVVGFFITKSRWTKIGRLMPWYAFCRSINVTFFLIIVLFLTSVLTWRVYNSGRLTWAQGGSL